ncbi:MAG: transcriptional repressor [Actinomycetia bacterium]|nr:transcriptional repressor [Actinomycetes bacterium]
MQTPAGEEPRQPPAASLPREVAAWEEQLRSHGFRITSQRELILLAIRDLSHPTQDTILSWVRRSAPGLNRTTVYRALALLESVGLVEHSHLGSGSPVYHLATSERHIHLSCRACGSVTSIDRGAAAGFEADLVRERGFAVDLSHTALTGLCAACLKADNEV